MDEEDLQVTPMERVDLPFLLGLWAKEGVLEHADEFPRDRGWSRFDEPDVAWGRYRRMRKELGSDYTQLILRMADGTPVGEAFFFPLPDGYTFGKWRKPGRITTHMGDIKLEPAVWGRGLGTAFLRLVVAYLFTNTRSQLFVVPPHRKNPAAIRVYEKAGFSRFKGMRSWRNHFIMELEREDFERHYSPQL